MITRKKKIILVGLVCIFILVCRGLFHVFPELSMVHSFQSSYYDMPCTLPNINPFDKSISDYFWEPEPLKCDSNFHEVIYVDENNKLRYNDTVLRVLSDLGITDIKCSFRNVVRTANDDDKIELVRVNLSVGSNAELPGDFVHAFCETNSTRVVYDDILTGIKESPRVRDVSSDSKVMDESQENLSVYLFGIDSVSRAASFRYLPKTRKYLTDIGAYDFKGLMKVGDNTLPNIMALLAGTTVSAEKMKDRESTRFDHYPFVWRKFSSRGYVTLFAEDMPHIGSFNNKMKGFRTQPTDHYMRPFWLGLRDRDRTKYKFQNVYRFLENKGLKIQENSVFCNQNTKNHMELINYFKKFLLQYRVKRKFAFTFFTELAHTFINFLHYGDEDFADLFKWLKQEGYLNNSVLIVFSDHGSRFNSLRNTFIGRMESRMPMLYIVLPDHIKSKYPDLDHYLTQNTKRLVTHYDLHQTLLDISKGNFHNLSPSTANNVSRGLSLFGEIPETRSCADASIPTDYCACYKSTPLQIDNNDEIKRISEAVVAYINDILSSEKYCKTLYLNRIVSAESMTLGLQYKPIPLIGQFFKPEENRVTYSVVIETKPGLATFDASCEVDPSGSFYIHPKIDRTNEYGNQSHCVANAALSHLCFC